MKKLIVLGLFGLLIMVSTVHAQQLDFKASGFIDAQSFWMVNTTQGNPAAGLYNTLPAAYLPPANPFASGVALNRKVAFMESRARLKFDAIMGKELSGTIFFEMDSQPWGNAPGGQGGQISERNTYGYWGGDRAAVEIKNVYIDFGLPYFGIPVPMSFRIGEQGLYIRPNLVMNTDGMAVKGALKIDPVTVEGTWGKAWEGDVAAADDADVYALHVNANVSTFKIGAYGIYYNMNTYPFAVSSNVGGIAGLPNSLKSLINGTQQAGIWWWGAYADGKAGPVNLNLDFVYDYGKVESKQSIVEDVKYRGWMARAKVDLPWEQFNFGFVGAYASGADTEKTSSSGLAGSVTPQGNISSKVKSFVTPVGSEAAPAFDESIVFYATGVNRGDSGIGNTFNYNQLSRGPMGGTWFAKLYGSYKVTPWYKLTLQGLYIGDTTKHGNTIGNAVSAVLNPATKQVLLKNSSNIGWEGDIINEIQIYKNLKYIVAFGYLLAGSALDLNVPNAAGQPTLRNISMRNPWALTTNLTYNF